MEFQEPDNDAFSFLVEPPHNRSRWRSDDDGDLAMQHLRGRFAVEGFPLVEQIRNEPRFTVDPRRSRLMFAAHEVSLTRKELKLVTTLFAADGDLVSYADLATLLWTDDPPPAFAVAIRAHARNIRLKLRSTGIPDNLITTVDGRGLRLNAST